MQIHRCDHNKVYSGVSKKGIPWCRSWRWICSKCGILGHDDLHKSFTPHSDVALYDKLYKEHYR